MPRLKLSVLDQSPISSGSTAAQALQQTLELAQVAERLGYHRYWVAEHHGSRSFAGSAPEILIGHIAERTQRIRVGSGGVMLMHYSPLKVAEWFKMLQVLHPGRIDLGIGRAPGSDGITAAALAYGSRLGVDYFPAKMADLIAFLNDRTPHTEALASVIATPPVERPPELWMLGSSEEGAKLAAYFGLPFSYAHFINPEHARRACDTYREQFQPSEELAEPQVNLGVFALCSEDEAEVEDLARCRDVWRLRVERGEFGPIPSVEEANAYRMSDEEANRVASRRKHQIVGTPDAVGERLRGLAEDLDAVEVSIVSITHDFAARVRGYELMAGAI